jgi:hypothetical protein
MAQYGLPIADISLGDSGQCAGNSDGLAYNEFDEGFGAGRGSGSGPDDFTTSGIDYGRMSRNVSH